MHGKQSSASKQENEGVGGFSTIWGACHKTGERGLRWLFLSYGKQSSASKQEKRGLGGFFCRTGSKILSLNR